MKQTLTWLLLPWLFCAVYVFGFQYPAVMDLPNHLARAHILNTCIGGSPLPMCQNFLAEFQPISYFFADYTIMVLLKIFSNPFFAGKIALFLILSINLFGWFFLFKRVRGEVNAAYVAGLLLLFNNFFYKGFYAYLLGNGALLLWIAFWWPRRDSHSFKASVLLSLALFVLYLCHLAAFFSAIACYCTYALWMFAKTPARLPILKSYLNDWFFGAAFIGIYGFQQYATGATLLGHVGMQGVEGGSSTLDWWLLKLVRFTYVTFNHSKYFDTLIFGLLLLCIAGCVSRAALRQGSTHFWLFYAGMLALAYLITPDISHGGADVDLRFLLPAYYMLFLGLGMSIENSRRSKFIAAALVSMQFALNFYYQFPMQKELSVLHRALEQIPPGQRLVEVNSRYNFPSGSLSRVNPLSHYATYYMLRDGALAGGMLNCYMNPNIPYFCYRNAEDSTSTFKSQFSGLPALSSEEIAALAGRFNYFLVIEPSPELVEQRMPSSQFERVYSEGDVYLLKYSAGAAL